MHPALRCGEAGLRDPCRNPVSWEVLGASGEHRECSGGSPVFFCRCCAFSREGCIGGRTGSTHEPHQVIPDHASCEQILRTNRPRSAQPAPLPSMPPVGSLSLSLPSRAQFRRPSAGVKHGRRLQPRAADADARTHTRYQNQTRSSGGHKASQDETLPSLIGLGRVCLEIVSAAFFFVIAFVFVASSLFTRFVLLARFHVFVFSVFPSVPGSALAACSPRQPNAKPTCPAVRWACRPSQTKTKPTCPEVRW